MDKIIEYMANIDFAIIPSRVERYSREDLDTDCLIVDSVVQGQFAVVLSEALELLLEDLFPEEERFTPPEVAPLTILTKSGGSFLPMNKL